MAYFMRFYKKISFLWMLALFLGTASLAFAAVSSIQIKSAELQLQDEYYSLSADVDIGFDNEIEEAINKGVPLNFLVEFQIVSPRQYWFDDEIVTISQIVTLSYHALSRQYLVNRGLHQKSFESLSEAKQELAQLSDWKVAEKSLLEKNETYKAFRSNQATQGDSSRCDSFRKVEFDLTKV
jgi:hypothetical protein